MNATIPRKQEGTTIMGNGVLCVIRAQDNLGAGVSEVLIGELMSL
jgi:hypothetical protein